MKILVFLTLLESTLGQIPQDPTALVAASLPAIGAQIVGGRTAGEYVFVGSEIATYSSIYLTYGKYLLPFQLDYTITFYCRRANTPFLFVTLDVIQLVANMTENFVFIFHGWTESWLQFYVNELADGYLKYVDPDANVCAIDYSYFVLPEYLQIVSPNVFNISKVVASFMTGLNQRFGVDYSDITFFGFSFGCHVAGVTSRMLNSSIGAIYASDPGCLSLSPLGDSCSNSKGLSKGAAKFVQVCASDQNFLGAFTADYTGDQVFFPNLGGPCHQNCNEYALCPHYFSIELMVLSLNPANYFGARQCTDVNSFKAGLCTNTPCNRLGPHSNRSITGNFYFFTAKSDPYTTNQTCPNADATTVYNQMITNGLATFTLNGPI